MPIQGHRAKIVTDFVTDPAPKDNRYHDRTLGGESVGTRRGGLRGMRIGGVRRRFVAF